MIAAWLGDEHGYEPVGAEMLDEPEVPDWSADEIWQYRAHTERYGRFNAGNMRYRLKWPHANRPRGYALAAAEALRQALSTSSGATPEV